MKFLGGIILEEKNITLRQQLENLKDNINGKTKKLGDFEISKYFKLEKTKDGTNKIIFIGEGIENSQNFTEEQEKSEEENNGDFSEKANTSELREAFEGIGKASEKYLEKLKNPYIGDKGPEFQEKLEELLGAKLKGVLEGRFGRVSYENYNINVLEKFLDFLEDKPELLKLFKKDALDGYKGIRHFAKDILTLENYKEVVNELYEYLNNNKKVKLGVPGFTNLFLSLSVYKDFIEEKSKLSLLYKNFVDDFIKTGELTDKNFDVLLKSLKDKDDLNWFIDIFKDNISYLKNYSLEIEDSINNFKFLNDNEKKYYLSQLEKIKNKE